MTMRKTGMFFLFLALAPSSAWAQAAAPGMFGVQEVIVEYARFEDAKAADSCGLSREQIADAIAKTLVGTGVPAVPVAEAKPPAMGVARIQLITEVFSRIDETLSCTSFVSLSAESKSNAILPPISTPRSITAVYWRRHAMIISGQSMHGQQITAAVQKMLMPFIQQYRVDQPPVIVK